LAAHVVASLHYAEPWDIEREVTALLLNQLANYAQARAEYAEAEPLFQRSLAILEKALGPDHPNTATVRSSYVALLQEMGRKAEADAVQALRRRAKRLIAWICRKS